MQEKAINVLKRAAEVPGEGSSPAVPAEVVAAAAGLMARLTEVSLQSARGGSGTPLGDGRGVHGRRVSQGFSEAKLEALRCAISAYGRHPTNVILFRSLLDLALSNLRRQAPPGLDWEKEKEEFLANTSPGDVLLCHSAVDALLSLTEVDLPRSHQVRCCRGPYPPLPPSLAR
jgi:hypothetical protein